MIDNKSSQIKINKNKNVNNNENQNQEKAVNVIEILSDEG